MLLHPELLSLGLADNCISDEGASSLAELLRYTDTLQRLVLSGNDIHDEGGGTLVAALSQNRSLKGLYLASVSRGGGWGEWVGRREESSLLPQLPCTRAWRLRGGRREEEGGGKKEEGEREEGGGSKKGERVTVH